MARNTTTTPAPQTFLDALSNPGKYGNGINCMNQFFGQGADASLQDHNLSFRAGNNLVTGVITTGYLNQDGVLPNSNFRRYSIRKNVEGNFTKWLKAAANVSMACTENNTLPESGSRGLLMEAIMASPLQSPYNKNEKIIPYLPADASGYFFLSRSVVPGTSCEG